MKRNSVLCWFLVALWMGLIFYFSAQPAEVSGGQSGGIIRLLLERFSVGFDTMSNQEQLEMIELWQHTVRKLAHFGIYAVLGMLCLTALYQHRFGTFVRPIAASVIAILYAASDEVHQFFVPGRSCELRDVCIDSFGAISGVLFLMLCIKIISIIRTKSAG